MDGAHAGYVTVLKCPPVSQGHQVAAQVELHHLYSALGRASKIGWLTQAKDQLGHTQKQNSLIPGAIIILEAEELSRVSSISESLDILVQHDFVTVVRFAERIYPDNIAEQRGINCVSCEYDELTPHPGVVAAFFYTLRTAKGGRVAMQSDGRGRAEMLCALHLMQDHGFSAGEAMAWLWLACPSLQLRQEQVDYLFAVGAFLEEAAATSHVARSEALRRAVSRVWAAEELRPFCRSRPQSLYNDAGWEGSILRQCLSPSRLGELMAACWVSKGAAWALWTGAGTSKCLAAGEGWAADATACTADCSVLPSPLRMLLC